MFIVFENIVLVKRYRYSKVPYSNGYSGRTEKDIVDENKPIKSSNIGHIFFINFCSQFIKFKS